ncbi:hypothetical protein [Thiomicrospira microaerophila]|uniref:hypothetical protein n=1 Tax=Thiomicrospira microaerophila TaxID=406020 RepID=UPI0018E074A3|nr:hypothetical protein [Thiomicrospira microaerophila]
MDGVEQIGVGTTNISLRVRDASDILVPYITIGHSVDYLERPAGFLVTVTPQCYGPNSNRTDELGNCSMQVVVTAPSVADETGSATVNFSIDGSVVSVSVSASS